MSCPCGKQCVPLRAADRAAQDPFIVARLEELFDDDIFSYAGWTVLRTQLYKASRKDHACKDCSWPGGGVSVYDVQSWPGSGAAAQCHQPP